MKKLFIIISLITIGVVAFSQTNVSGRITSNTTWTQAGSPYIVTASVTVNSNVTLTIQSGVEVRFENNTSLTTQGTLTANNVIFTSNTGTEPGLWGNLRFSGGSTANLNDIQVMYATWALLFENPCTFNLTGESGFNSVLYPLFNLDFTYVDADMHLPKLNLPYYSGHKVIQQGANLSIGAGVTIKMAASCGIYINDGTIEAIGTEEKPILFTTVSDEEAGGYTNPTAPASAKWKTIRISKNDSTQNRFENCTFKYAGVTHRDHGYNTEEAIITVRDGAGVSIKNCSFEEVHKRDVGIESRGVVRLENSTLRGPEYPVFMRADATLDVINCTLDDEGIKPYKAIYLWGDKNIEHDAHLKVISFNNEPNLAYANNSWIGVPNGMTLTVDPGVVIKGFNTSGRFEVSGKLIADGTEADPIVFTSIHDDRFGSPGDSNNNGVDTSPSLGQWGGILFFDNADSGSSLTHCEFHYVNFPHGKTFQEQAVYPHSAIALFHVSPRIESCRFIEANVGVKAYGTASPIIRNNYFDQIKHAPVVISGASNPVFDNNTWGDQIKHRAIGLTGLNQFQNGSLKQINDAGYENISYYLYDSWVVRPGANMLVEPGVVVKVADGKHIHVYGGMKIDGTVSEPVIFTELRDDNYGTPADTESDGNATSPVVNRWGGIVYYNGADTEFSKVKHAEFRYGGAAGLRDSYTYSQGISPLTHRDNLHNTSRSGVVTFSRVAIDIEDSKFFTSGHGLSYFGPEATGNAKRVIIESCNHTPITKTWSAVPHFEDVEFVNNTFNAVYLHDSKIDYDVTLGKTPGIIGSNTYENAVYTSANTHILTDASVEVNPGLIIKNSGFLVDGELKLNGTAAERITMTSIHDDSKGGDTNNNGNATSPAKGNWYYSSDCAIVFRNTASDNLIRFTDLAYSYHGVQASNSKVIIEDSMIEQLSSKGVIITGTSDVKVRRTAFNNLEVPIRKTAFSTAELHEGNTASNVSTMGVELISETLNTSGTLPLYTFAGHPNITYWITGTMSIAKGVTLTIPAGASFKRWNYRYNEDSFNVSGTLDIEGTEVAPVVITDEREDGYGSPLDFNQDGTVTQNYARPDKVYIRFNPGSAGTLEHLILKSNAYGVYVNGASPVLRNVLFDNLGRGISVTAVGSEPVIENSVFHNTTYPLETSLLCFPASLAGNSFTGSTFKGIKVPEETLNQNATLSPRPFGELENAPYIFDNYTINAELTIEPGVKGKFNNGKGITVNRWLKAIGTAEKPIVFTSIYDDFYGGDTNADGTATVASGSTWYGITFADASIDGECKLEHVLMRYAYEAVTTNSASPSLNYVTFYNNRNGVSAKVASNPVIRNCDFVGMTQRAVFNESKSFEIEASDCWWGDELGPVVAANPQNRRQAISEAVNFSPHKTTGLNQPLFGDVSTNGIVQAFDAALVLQAAAGLITLDEVQKIAADASGDGTISAYDATLILEYVAGLRPDLPTAMKAPQKLLAEMELIPGVISEENRVELPILFRKNFTSVGVDLTLSYDPELLQLDAVNLNSKNNYMQAVRIDNESGTAVVSAASAQSGNDELWGNLWFSLAPNVDESFETAVSIERFDVNESDFGAIATAIVRYNLPTGLNSLGAEASIRCYPNPVKDVLYIHGADDLEHVKIYDISGRMILNREVFDGKVEMGHLRSGLYLIEIIGKGFVHKETLLKK